MNSIPYVFLNGNCREALDVYANLLGGEIVRMVRYSDMPDDGGPDTCLDGGGAPANPFPDGWQDKLAFAELRFGGAALRASDCPPQFYAPQAGFSVNVSVDTTEEAERIFAGLSEGGFVNMPMGETFWAHRFGGCIDRFGIPWMIGCEKTM